MRYPETGGYQTHAKVAVCRESCARDDSSILNRRQGCVTDKPQPALGRWCVGPESHQRLQLASISIAKTRTPLPSWQ